MASMTGNPDPGAAAEDAMKRTAQGAHEMVDRVAEKAGPAVDRLRDGVNSAAESLHSTVDELSELEERWVEATRECVRSHPLLAIGLAVAAGMLISRMTAR